MPNEKKITIYEIAQEAGVSVATVSRVLTGNARVSRDKKDKVLELIRKYNFKPSAVARGLSDTRSRIIGIIVADVRNSFYADMYVACENAASREGYSVMLMNSFGRLDMEENQIEKLAQWRVDAVIQLGGAVDDIRSNPEYVRKVNEVAGNIPLVVSGRLDGTDCYRVSIDHAAAMDMLVEHLYEQGNRRIALIGGRKDVESTYIKYSRFLELADRYNLEKSSLYTENWGGYGMGEGENAMDELLYRFRLASRPLPDAIICINDSTASGVVRRLHAEHLTIPRDISVASYDNVDICEVVEPSLTSVAYDYEEMGRAMVSTALNAVNGVEQDHLKLIKPKELVVRMSSAYQRR